MSFARAIGFYIALILPVLLLLGYLLDGLFNFTTVAFVFIAIPILDFIGGKSKNNIDGDNAKLLSGRFYFKAILYLWVYLQIIVVIFGAYAVSVGKVDNFLEWLGFVLSTGLLTGGIGITVAHELGHKSSKLERFYAKALLMTVSYMHFHIEHNRGHHVNVATPLDPATARKNEPLYFFFARTIVGSYFHAWAIEKKLLAKNGRKLFSFHNSMIWYSFLPFVFCGILVLGNWMITSTWHFQIVYFFFAQSLVAILLLEAVNYIEHYGIVRKEISPGHFERVKAVHSWDSYFNISNFFLFQLQRHADHHLNATRRYQVLQSHEESPTLPAGYPTMILAAFIPPLWFRLANPLLEKHQLRAA